MGGPAFTFVFLTFMHLTSFSQLWLSRSLREKSLTTKDTKYTKGGTRLDFLGFSSFVTFVYLVVRKVLSLKTVEPQLSNWRLDSDINQASHLFSSQIKSRCSSDSRPCLHMCFFDLHRSHLLPTADRAQPITESRSSAGIRSCLQFGFLHFHEICSSLGSWNIRGSPAAQANLPRWC